MKKTTIKEEGRREALPEHPEDNPPQPSQGQQDDVLIFSVF
jgi:hypothetical protein